MFIHLFFLYRAFLTLKRLYDLIFSIDCNEILKFEIPNLHGQNAKQETNLVCLKVQNLFSCAIYIVGIKTKNIDKKT